MKEKLACRSSNLRISHVSNQIFLQKPHKDRYQSINLSFHAETETFLIIFIPKTPKKRNQKTPKEAKKNYKSQLQESVFVTQREYKNSRKIIYYFIFLCKDKFNEFFQRNIIKNWLYFPSFILQDEKLFVWLAWKKSLSKIDGK